MTSSTGFQIFKNEPGFDVLGTGKEVSKYNLVNKSQKNEVVLEAALKNIQQHLGLLHLKRAHTVRKSLCRT